MRTARAHRRRPLRHAATVVLAVSGLVVSPVPPSSAAAPAYKVMPLGDSITAGYLLVNGQQFEGGYRPRLWDRLVNQDGDALDFVGSLSSGPASLPDRNHEGHGGWRTDQLLDGIDAWMAAYQPDAVLLEIGTNDVLQSYQLSSAPDRLNQIVTKVCKDRAGVNLLVATIPPVTGQEARVDDYNAAIPGIVSDAQATGCHASLVDMHSALTESDLFDGIHPTAAGYDTMADVWYDQLAPLMSPSRPRADAGAAQTVAPGAKVTLDGSKSSDPSGGTLTYAWTRTTGPAVTLSDPAAVRPAFTAPGSPGTLTFQLIVSSGTASSAPASVQVTVAEPAPVADAGAAQTVAPGANVTLDGSKSTGSGLTYAWTQTSGTTVELSDPAAARPTFTAPAAPDSLRFELVVGNDTATSSPSTVTITVAAPPPPPPPPPPGGGGGGGAVGPPPGPATGTSPVSPPTSATPAAVTVQDPAGGPVSVTPGAPGAPSGWTAVGPSFTVTAPAGSAEAPLQLVFRVDGSALGSGLPVAVFRDGALVGACTGTTAVPDPCVSARRWLSDGDVEVVVLSSHASLWQTAVPAAGSIDTACAVGAAGGFTDMAGNVHAAAATCLRSYGITNGLSDTAYGPSGLVTRAQMASFLARLLRDAGVALPTGAGAPFTDVPATSPHATAIAQLYALGVVQGQSETRYAPDATVTRGQMASFLVRAYTLATGHALPAAAAPFADVAGDFHAADIAKVAAIGITTGITATQYAPGLPVRRDQMASFLARTLDLLVVAGRAARIG